jgi:hypothetical protein
MPSPTQPHLQQRRFSDSYFHSDGNFYGSTYVYFYSTSNVNRDDDVAVVCLNDERIPGEF